MEMKFCQSCGMPMQEEKQYGTEADASKSTEYCVYCYRNGAFTANITMDEMIEVCIPHMVETGQWDEDGARKQMQAFFPQLKRWKK